MKSFDELVDGVLAADVSGWVFEWLDGRATEERPPWGHARILAEQMAQADSALDLDTGGREVVNEVPCLPRTMVVTESWTPNARRAPELLIPRGVKVVETVGGSPPPFPVMRVDFVTARHPVIPAWTEIALVIRPEGQCLAQPVGPASAFELIEHFVGPRPKDRRGRGPEEERTAAECAGLVIDDLRTARCRREVNDVDAVVWILRKCVWWIPNFDVTRYDAYLRSLDAQMRAGPVRAHYAESCTGVLHESLSRVSSSRKNDRFWAGRGVSAWRPCALASRPAQRGRTTARPGARKTGTPQSDPASDISPRLRQ